MDFALPRELELFRRNVRRFVDSELIPLESATPHELSAETRARLRDLAKRAGLWLVDVPEALGGQGLSTLAQAVFWEEISRSVAIAPRDFTVFGPMVGPILLGLDGELRERYLLPVLVERKTACFAQTEPDAGSDPGAMKTRAVRRGTDYLINGVKRFITDAECADFAQLMALTDPSARTRGISRPSLTKMVPSACAAMPKGSSNLVRSPPPARTMTLAFHPGSSCGVRGRWFHAQNSNVPPMTQSIAVHRTQLPLAGLPLPSDVTPESVSDFGIRE